MCIGLRPWACHLSYRFISLQLPYWSYDAWNACFRLMWVMWLGNWWCPMSGFRIRKNDKLSILSVWIQNRPIVYSFPFQMGRLFYAALTMATSYSKTYWRWVRHAFTYHLISEPRIIWKNHVESTGFCEETCCRVCLRQSGWLSIRPFHLPLELRNTPPIDLCTPPSLVLDDWLSMVYHHIYFILQLFTSKINQNIYFRKHW